MLMNCERSALLVVDVQERLLPHMAAPDVVLANTRWLVHVARKLGVPVMATEQYPKGLGHSHPELAALLEDPEVRVKEHFSCVAARCLDGAVGCEREQIVLCGIEAHVCVLQTALDLRWQGRQVFVVADAVSSRDPANTMLALARMREHGVEVVCREMVAFEWLGRAGTDRFREVSRELIR